jgi:hypothetical protein
MQRIIPHFENFPLISAKQNDFVLFKKVCEIVESHEHLDKIGFKNVIALAYEMNGSGKRKRSKEEMFKFFKDKDIV